MTEINKNQQTNSSICDKENNKKIKFFCLKKICSSWKEFSPSKPFIATSCVLLGIGVTLIAQNLTKNHQNYLVIRNHFPFPSSIAFADDDFFDQIEEMEKEMAQHRKNIRKVFEDAEKKSAASSTSKVYSSEDDKNYFYHLDFLGFKKEEIVVGIKDNSVSFSAESKKSGEDKNNSVSSHSTSFHYSFSVPQYDTKKEPEIIRKDNQIVVKLAKK